MGLRIFKPFSPFQKLFQQKTLNAILVGLDSVGKSTILQKLKIGEVKKYCLSIGFNIKTVEYRKVQLTAFNFTTFSYQSKFHKQLYQQYYQVVQATIFVVDASDALRVEAAREILQQVLFRGQFAEGPLLVIANKQDIAKVPLSEIEEKLGLKALKRPRYIQEACALTGKGLLEGFTWLANQFDKP